MTADQHASPGDADPSSDGSISASAFPIGPSVQTHSHLRFLHPLIGVCGQVSPSDPDSSESRFNGFLMFILRLEERFGMLLWLIGLTVLPLDGEAVDASNEDVDDASAAISVVGECV